jgi:hypothetical protein
LLCSGAANLENSPVDVDDECELVRSSKI